jgi:hypothetical protein
VRSQCAVLRPKLYIHRIAESNSPSDGDASASLRMVRLPQGQPTAAATSPEPAQAGRRTVQLPA